MLLLYIEIKEERYKRNINFFKIENLSKTIIFLF